MPLPEVEPLVLPEVLPIEPLVLPEVEPELRELRFLPRRLPEVVLPLVLLGVVFIEPEVVPIEPEVVPIEPEVLPLVEP